MSSRRRTEWQRARVSLNRMWRRIWETYTAEMIVSGAWHTTYLAHWRILTGACRNGVERLGATLNKPVDSTVLCRRCDYLDEGAMERIGCTESMVS